MIEEEEEEEEEKSNSTPYMRARRVQKSRFACTPACTCTQNESCPKKYKAGLTALAAARRVESFAKRCIRYIQIVFYIFMPTNCTIFFVHESFTIYSFSLYFFAYFLPNGLHYSCPNARLELRLLQFSY